jgi:hypothetical protein
MRVRRRQQACPESQRQARDAWRMRAATHRRPGLSAIGQRRVPLARDDRPAVGALVKAEGR